MYKIEYKPLIKDFEEFNEWCRYGNSHFNLSCSNICKPYKIVARCCEYSEYFEYSQKGFDEAMQWLTEKRTLILKALGAAKQIESLQKRLDEKCDTCIDRDKKNTAKEIIQLLSPDCEQCDENWHEGCLCLRATLAEKIAKHYGLEDG